jgi:bifunctional non-homologous end joining protein LigD
MSPPLRPCIPTRALTPPTGERWVHEVKFDGYRLLASHVGQRVVLRTRAASLVGALFSHCAIAAQSGRLLNHHGRGSRHPSEDGVSDFDALHGRAKDAWAILLAFDLLEIEGEDLRGPSLVERKRRLRRALEPTRRRLAIGRVPRARWRHDIRCPQPKRWPHRRQG